MSLTQELLPRCFPFTAYRRLNLIVGRWTTEEDTIDVKASISADGNLTFDDTNVKLRDRYMSNGIRCVFDYFDVVSTGTTLSGKLQLYSLSLREPERPMFVILKKKRM